VKEHDGKRYVACRLLFKHSVYWNSFAVEISFRAGCSTYIVSCGFLHQYHLLSFAACTSASACGVCRMCVCGVSWEGRGGLTEGDKASELYKVLTQGGGERRRRHTSCACFATTRDMLALLTTFGASKTRGF